MELYHLCKEETIKLSLTISISDQHQKDDLLLQITTPLQEINQIFSHYVLNTHPNNLTESWITRKGAPAPIIRDFSHGVAPKMNPKI